MATSSKPTTPSRARRKLAANVYIRDEDGAGGQWYGPSYPEAGDPPAEAAAGLPDSAFDVRATWPTPDDAARVGLDYGGGPDVSRVHRDDEGA
ncbi:hypothetical protein MXD62_19480 [Frankia sp. Mgl5]|uniref:hypothetical protein n=1 Tax=Frankia sp. Mgl5 TaxID=2933793 RepID=UPI002010A5BA|nr:hypothetical protein [Frankia sp. Mgl5]MCK9929334.1 hypothetical protein [Frankia sp. Mgl5]